MRKQDEVDLSRSHKDEYAAPKEPILVDIGVGHYLAIAGRGSPGGDEFTAKLGALYGVAYTVRMIRNAAGRQDYVIGKLEAQWWAEDESTDFAKVRTSDWRWRLLIRTPDFVEDEEVAEAVEVLLTKGKGAEVKEVRLTSLAEGPCVQMLHIGPYDKERSTIAEMTEFAKRQGLAPAGRHHEVYLSDPRRIPPERLRTILRLPVRPGLQANCRAPASGTRGPC